MEVGRVWFRCVTLKDANHYVKWWFGNGFYKHKYYVVRSTTNPRFYDVMRVDDGGPYGKKRIGLSNA